MAGYSGTPLAKKLGLKGGQRLAFLHSPPGFADLLGPLPDGSDLVGDEPSGRVDLAVMFAERRAVLEGSFAPWADRLEPDASLWVAWPKKASKVSTDLTGDVVRAIGLASGLVDVKVCAIDEVWSGLKFVYRTKDRPARRHDGGSQ